MKFLYQFSARDSFIHHLDPRSKLVFILCFLLATFLLPYPWIMPFVIVGLIWGLAGIGPLEYLPFILFLLPLMLAITIIHLLTDGPPYLELAGLPLSAAGLENGLLVASRLAAMGIAFIMFSMTTDPFDWGMAMYQSGLSYKVAFMFAFALRFFPLLPEELVVIRNALTARAYHAIGSRNPYTFLKGVAISIMPLGLGALRRSQDIAMAMELRGFNYAETIGVRRTVFRDIRMRRRDWVVVALSVAFLIASAVLAVRLGTFPAIPTPWLVFLGVLAVGLILVAWRVSQAVQGSGGRPSAGPSPS
jgi:energy-coupling factor transport system permease protein